MACHADGLGTPIMALRQGLTLAHFRAQLEDLRDTPLTLELKLSIFGTHLGFIWAIWGTK